MIESKFDFSNYKNQGERFLNQYIEDIKYYGYGYVKGWTKVKEMLEMEPKLKYEYDKEDEIYIVSYEEE